MWLSRHTGRRDVTFGITVSGRPPEIVGVERMVGLFINTVPLRVVLDPAEQVETLLRRIQSEQAELLEHQHLGLVQIQRIAGIGELFDTSFAFENYPIRKEAVSTAMEGARLCDVRMVGGDTTHYPLSLLVIPGEHAELRFGYRQGVFDATIVEAMAQRYTHVLAAFVLRTEALSAEISVLPPPERTQLL
ncbi:condensation domain-containing protein, partial [Xanthomonas sp. D-93]|uniref:condensation domain-containing protein n=1 Tax=Xanthomonas sp. D-93 TaxID=2821272 RepID=UPI0031BAC125